MSKGAQMAVIRKLISWWRLMSRKLTSLLEFDGSETGRNRSFADLVPPGWASCEENLSRNIYAFLEFTHWNSSLLLLSFYFHFIVQGNEYRKERSKFNSRTEKFVIIQSLNVMRGSRRCKFMAKTLSYELSQVSEFNKFRVSIEFPRVSNCSSSNF